MERAGRSSWRDCANSCSLGRTEAFLAMSSSAKRGPRGPGSDCFLGVFLFSFTRYKDGDLVHREQILEYARSHHTGHLYENVQKFVDGLAAESRTSEKKIEAMSSSVTNFAHVMAAWHQKM